MIFSNIKNFYDILKNMKKEQKKIVFTNGCFDIIHRGHIYILSESKKLGDILILGLNSDSSIRRIKGPQRPINSEEDRAYVLDNIKSVDYVVLFEEDTPYNLIENILPDFLVKGGDWEADKIVGSDILRKYGGKVISIPYIDDFSTSSIIKKIKEQNS
jgi:D-glycero-beta-D-manno-heptose 1-phosphate adenylyltransferase